MNTYIRYTVRAISVTLALVTVISTLFIILVTTLSTLVDTVEDTLDEPVIEPDTDLADDIVDLMVVTQPIEADATPQTIAYEGLAWSDLQKVAKSLGVTGRKKADVLAGLALVAPCLVSNAMHDTLGLF